MKLLIILLWLWPLPIKQSRYLLALIPVYEKEQSNFSVLSVRRCSRLLNETVQYDCASWLSIVAGAEVEFCQVMIDIVFETKSSSLHLSLLVKRGSTWRKGARMIRSYEHAPQGALETIDFDLIFPHFGPMIISQIILLSVASGLTSRCFNPVHTPSSATLALLLDRTSLLNMAKAKVQKFQNLRNNLTTFWAVNLLHERPQIWSFDTLL